MNGGRGLSTLHAVSGLAWLDALGPQRIRPGLSRTLSLLASLGNPQFSFSSILIGGTNGKGSTAAAISAILTAAGVPCGLYTSPHLVSVTERVRLLDRDVSPAHLDDALSLVARISSPGVRGPTYFEALTVAAFELFRRARVQTAIVEVGIGGRLDATNVLEPEVSVVTNVGADHLDVLGPTLEDVAREKAGIFRKGRPALVGMAGAEPGARAALHAEARRIGARLVEIPPLETPLPGDPLPGAHQQQNLALALAAARAVAPLDEAAVARGLAAVRWPGRLQTLSKAGFRTLLLDGAHNPPGAGALAAHLDARGLAGRVDLLFGGMADKDLAAVFAPLAARARRIVLVAPGSPRAETPETLRVRIGRPELETASSVAEGLRRLEEAGGDGPILVAGSLYLVGEVLRLRSGA
ncbi:MAG: bifunctional folylpolyglutamate synthase/dihydrofolate synthase [Thermoanaerobaculia bacterium]|nr:bifunctional folylpolyglutamate synthase/dihydrofolate synthase [Thermoanaerobaculia bacterium]